MSDTEGTKATKTEEANDKVDDAMRKFHSALHDHEELTKGELQKVHRELTDALNEAQAADKREKDELRESIGKVSKWIEEEEKSRTEKDKVKHSSSTIVTPPEDVAPPPPPTPESHVTSEGGESQHGGKRGWRRIW